MKRNESRRVEETEVEKSQSRRVATSESESFFFTFRPFDLSTINSGKVES